MKRYVLFLSLWIPALALAQNPQGINQQDMQKMMQQMQQQMQQVEDCMQKVDQSHLQKLEQRGREFEDEVRSLCAAGKRDQAQSKAIAFGQAMAKDPALLQMKKCTEMMQGMMQGMLPEMPDFEDYEDDSTHVCESL